MTNLSNITCTSSTNNVHRANPLHFPDLRIWICSTGFDTLPFIRDWALKLMVMVSLFSMNKHSYITNRVPLFLSRIKNTPQQRYEELLEEHPNIIQRILQHYIASYLGITPVSLSHVRNRR